MSACSADLTWHACGWGGFSSQTPCFGMAARENACLGMGLNYPPCREWGPQPRVGSRSGGTYMSSIAAYGSLSAADHSRQLRKAVIAATVGTTIEWYDFFLYGTA